MAFMCLLGLIMLCLFLTDTRRPETIRVFISSGEDVHLPCNNALSECTSTTWIYSRHSETVELVAEGKTKKDTNRHERLSLGSNCALYISKVTEDDYGLYSCRQYVNKQQHGTDASILLLVLHVSSSSSQTEIRPGRSVTLYCQLESFHGFTCNDLDNEKIDLMWVNQTGVSLVKDSRYDISSSPCKVSLTTTLRNDDQKREWRCQLTQKNQLKTSATFTVEYSVSNETKRETAVSIPEETTTVNTAETPSQPGGTGESGNGDGVSPSVIQIVVIFAVLALLIIAVVLCMNYKKKASKSRGTDFDTEVTDLHGNKNTINFYIDPTPNTNEQKDDVTYTEVVTYNKLRANKVDDQVTYSFIRGEKDEV